MKKALVAAKGFVAGVLVTAMLSGVAVMASPDMVARVFGVRVEVDGAAVNFAADSQPFIIEGRTFLPVGAIADALGFEVEWDAATQTVSVATGGATPSIDPTITAPVDAPIDARGINPITPAEITAFQVAWGEALVSIATAFAEGDDYVTIAAGVLDDLYGYAENHVLFKPTIASEVPFRFTWEQAASYFIGSSVEAAGLEPYEEDGTGFATNPWTNVVFCPSGRYILNGETALWMGSVYITDADGDVTRVEKSIGLFRAEDGNVRMQLHHSSVPFQ
jgi:hypothetical protein